MTASSRLDKLFPALTAKERGLLVLHAWKEGEEEDRQVRSTIPPGQVPVFNRYIGLMNGANQHLSPLILLLQALADQLSIKYGWLLSLGLWGNEASFRTNVDSRKPVKIARGNKEREAEAPFPDRLLEVLLANLCERIPLQWRELRAVEMVVEEIEQEFGEDPLLPGLRDILGHVRATLTDLHPRLRNLEPDLDDLPEPDEQTLYSTRRLAYREVPDKRP